MDDMIRVGTADLDVTPPLGVRMAGGFQPVYAEDVHDPLRAKAVVIAGGESRVAFVALDVVALSLEDVRQIRDRVAATTEILPDHILIGCTHTHSGPATQSIHEVDKEQEYVEWLIQRVADTIRIAERRLTPARVGWGRGELHGFNFCRRFKMRDGTVRMNPGRGNPDIIEPTSPVDPTVGVLYAQNEAGEPLAVIAQFGMHYVGTDGRGAISADYFGQFAATVREFYGPACTPLLINGALGQVNNVNPFDTHNDRGHARGRRVARALAGEVLKVVGRMRLTDRCDLGAVTAELTLPRKAVTPEDVRVAHAIVAGQDPVPNQGPFSHIVGQPIPERMRPVYARHLIRLNDMPKNLHSEVQAIRVGESVWVGLPGQTFTEIGFAISADSPSPFTFVLNLANDNLGYIPTDKAQLKEGGYETWGAPSNPVGTGAEAATIDVARGVVAQLFAASSQRSAG